jgi:hypothetical protein
MDGRKTKWTKPMPIIPSDNGENEIHVSERADKREQDAEADAA